ncbi:MAG: DUF262 domain-containing protein, partial [Myxococcota bacterium]
ASDAPPGPPDAEAPDSADVPQVEPPTYRLQARDISRRASRPTAVGYYLGPMILQRSDRSDDLRIVYDGQQRLTTLALLLAAFRDLLDEESDRAIVRQCLVLPTGAPRLEAPTPGGAVSRITGADGGARFSSRADRSEPDGRLYEGVARLRALPERWSAPRRRAFLAFLLDEVWITVTYIDDRRLAEMAYVTVNTRGLRLDASDVLKGHLVQVVSRVSLSRGRALAEAWDRLRREAGPHFEPLLRAVDFSLFGRVRTHDFGEELIEAFPEGGDRATERIEAWVEGDLRSAWGAFSRVVDEPEPLDPSALALHRLRFLGWTEWHAVAIAMVERWEGAELAGRLQALQRACTVMHLLGWSFYPERRARLLHQALLEIQDQLNPFRASPAGPAAVPGPLHFFEEARADARSALLGPLSEHQSFAPLVRLAETCLWDEASMPGFVGRGAVAHVLPRTHGQAWQRGFPSDDDRERSKHRLGNLCLVPGDVDEAVRALGFAEKRTRLGALDPRWRSAHDVARYDVWTVGMVETRTQQLASRVARQLGIAGG